MLYLFPMTKRKLLALETKKKLIDAACGLLVEKGFDAINVEEITRAANVGKGTFYTYFRRKEDIVLEISRAPFRETVDEISRMESVGIVSSLSYYMKRFVSHFQRFGINVCRQWAREVLNPRNASDGVDGAKWLYDLADLKKLLKEAIERGELEAETPVETLAHIFICELYGLMTSWCMSDGNFDPAQHMDRIGKILVGPILKPYLGEKNEIPKIGRS